MIQRRLSKKVNTWIKRYLPGELWGTLCALFGAWVSFHLTHSYSLATAAGWTGEGIGFYGYMMLRECIVYSRTYQSLSLVKRLIQTITTSGSNLLIEFLPAELVDTFLIRPLFMYITPQYIHPYALGFLVGKLAADLLFYSFVISVYELTQFKKLPKRKD